MNKQTIKKIKFCSAFRLLEYLLCKYSLEQMPVQLVELVCVQLNLPQTSNPEELLSHLRVSNAHLRDIPHAVDCDVPVNSVAFELWRYAASHNLQWGALQAGYAPVTRHILEAEKDLISASLAWCIENSISYAYQIGLANVHNAGFEFLATQLDLRTQKGVMGEVLIEILEKHNLLYQYLRAFMQHYERTFVTAA